MFDEDKDLKGVEQIANKFFFNQKFGLKVTMASENNFKSTFIYPEPSLEESYVRIKL